MKTEQKTDSLLIREYRAEDKPKVKELAENSFTNTSDVYWAIRDLEQSDKAFVATIDDVVVGTIEIDYIPLSSGRHAQIGYIFTHADYRGLGIASKLMGGAIDFLRHRNIDVLWAVTEQENHASRKLFKKFGFKEIKKPQLLLEELSKEDLMKLLHELVYWNGDVILKKRL